MPSGCHTVFYDNDLGLAEIHQEIKASACFMSACLELKKKSSDNNKGGLPSVHKNVCVFKSKQSMYLIFLINLDIITIDLRSLRLIYCQISLTGSHLGFSCSVS